MRLKPLSNCPERSPVRIIRACIAAGIVLVVGCETNDRDWSTATTAGQSGAAGAGNSPNASAGSPTPIDSKPQPTPEQCMQQTTDEHLGVFVEPTLGMDSANCGSRTLPCQTLQKAITRAHGAGKSVVYAAAGTYIESLSLAPGITVSGGWSVFGDSWAPICTPTASAQTVIQAPASANISVRADNLEAPAALRRLTILSKAQSAVVRGESLYGIFASGASTKLELEDVVVRVANAGDGLDGEVGSDAANAAEGGCDPASDGADAATPGSIGSGAKVGSFNASGYVAASGERGGLGERGHNGTQPIAPECRRCYGCTTGTDGLCWGGTGSNQSCGTIGKPGCGAQGGNGGGGGHGGGSSIALFVWQASVRVIRGQLESGNGGAGALGGDGGKGGLGVVGVAGQPGAECGLGCSTYKAPCAEGRGSGAAGEPGGKGGKGSKGGAGGAGAGGFSYAIYRDTTAQVEITDARLVHGSAGISLGNGTPGSAAPQN